MRHEFARVFVPAFFAILAGVGCSVPAGNGEEESVGKSDEALSGITGIGVLGIQGKCLDDPGGALANGTPVQIWDCNGSENQRWTVSSNGMIHPAANQGVCLDLPNWNTANGTKLQLWQCNGGSNQQWTLNGRGQIVGYGGKCMDDPGFNTTNGTPFQVWDCLGNAAQNFSLLPLAVSATVDLSLGSSVQGSARVSMGAVGDVNFAPSATNSDQATGYDYQWSCVVEDTNGVAYTVAYSGNVTNAPFNALQGTHVTDTPHTQIAMNPAIAKAWPAIVAGFNKNQVRCQLSAEPTWSTTITNILNTIAKDIQTAIGYIEQYGPIVIQTIALIAP